MCDTRTGLELVRTRRLHSLLACTPCDVAHSTAVLARLLVVVVGLSEADLSGLVIEDRVVLAEECVTEDDNRVCHLKLDAHDSDTSLATTETLHHVVLRGQLVRDALVINGLHVDLQCLELVVVAAVTVDPDVWEDATDNIRWPHEE